MITSFEQLEKKLEAKSLRHSAAKIYDIVRLPVVTLQMLICLITPDCRVHHFMIWHSPHCQHLGRHVENQANCGALHDFILTKLKRMISSYNEVNNSA